MNFHSKKYSPCLNCGKQGHEQKNCNEPTTSWGIILVKIPKNEIIKQNQIDKDQENRIVDRPRHTDLNQAENDHGLPSQTIKTLGISASCMEKIQFLLIRRKHSLGFDEFISGRYMLENTTGIKYLFEQMTPEELDIIRKSTFDQLWEFFWGKQNSDTLSRRYEESKEKFEKLKSKTNVESDLDFFLDTTPLFPTPEWGFPKGRKKRGEDDQKCAIREFCEETGLNSTDINILKHVMPIREDHIGTNGKKYRHIYFMAELVSDITPCIKNNNYEHSEIGDIGFFNYAESISLLREYHREKREILGRIMKYYIKQISAAYESL